MEAEGAFAGVGFEEDAAGPLPGFTSYYQENHRSVKDFNMSLSKRVFKYSKEGEKTDKQKTSDS